VEWINEFKLSPTLSPELDEEYEARCDDEDMDHTTRMRHCKRGTSIYVQDNLKFVKHIYVDVKIYVIGVRPRFILQDRGVGLGGHN
jgi:hypothetical protein